MTFFNSVKTFQKEFLFSFWILPENLLILKFVGQNPASTIIATRCWGDTNLLRHKTCILDVVLLSDVL